MITSALSQAQNHPESYIRIDRLAKSVPDKVETNIDSLANYLLSIADNDREKIRSFFIWTANAITYDTSAYEGNRNRVNQSINDILDRRTAVCYGYSQLMDAFFNRANIVSKMISGYSRPRKDSIPDTETPNHSWNAVHLDGEWYLLDVTWSRRMIDTLVIIDDYFLAEPTEFIKTHLPQDPIYQFLPYPLSVSQFEYIDSSRTFIDSLNFLNFQDSIALYELKEPILQKLETAIRSYNYNPTQSQSRELSTRYLEYESEFDDLLMRYQSQDKHDSIITLTKEMISLCNKATSLASLLLNQSENCAINHFNYGVALYSKHKRKENKIPLKVYQEILLEFKTVHSALSKLDRINFFTEAVIQQTIDYIDLCNKEIKNLSR